MRFVVFLICSTIGFVIGHYLLTGAAAAYVSVIVSYHLYLAYLVVTTVYKAGISLPVGQTTMTHLAFLFLVISLPYLRQHIPFFSIVTLFVPALAPFEANWLFNREKNSMREEDWQDNALSQPAEQLLRAATAEDHEAFLAYMRRPDRAFRKHGHGVREEYALWLEDRGKKKPIGASETASGD
jgi:hypothetical protein